MATKATKATKATEKISHKALVNKGGPFVLGSPWKKIAQRTTKLSRKLSRKSGYKGTISVAQLKSSVERHLLMKPRKRGPDEDAIALLIATASALGDFCEKAPSPSETVETVVGPLGE